MRRPLPASFHKTIKIQVYDGRGCAAQGGGNPLKTALRRCTGCEQANWGVPMAETAGNVQGGAPAAQGAGGTAAEEAVRLKRRAVASKLAAAAFGEITAVLMRSPLHANLPIGELQWAVLPAVLNRQFSLIHVQTPDGRVAGPLGVVLWASVSPEIDAKLMASLGKPLRLTPKDRRSGTIHWITDAVGAPAHVNQVLARLRQPVFKSQPVKVVVKGADGTLTVATR